MLDSVEQFFAVTLQRQFSLRILDELLDRRWRHGADRPPSGRAERSGERLSMRLRPDGLASIQRRVRLLHGLVQRLSAAEGIRDADGDGAAQRLALRQRQAPRCSIGQARMRSANARYRLSPCPG